ncbi:ComEC/Rec2 family competence protein [Sphingomonas abaci]|uniref:Competence protein ComEC n=1 Tax=Sphingomonas abaci TaxID=237611 RepID=A0A7W7AHR1_9SPHN|nr:ComEC/Rec2 family competence protein [Sphingomonas abaci]MBB4616272.1 competence protein ComEC [Sphingomonas abaci]
MARSAAAAPSMAPTPGQIPAAAGEIARRIGAAVERRLEAERDQLPLWLPVMLGLGVALWFVLPNPVAWRAAAWTALATGLAALVPWRGGRGWLAVALGALLVAAGVALAWSRAERVAAPVLAAPAIVRLDATVARVEPLPARGLVRLTLRSAAAGVTASGRPMALPPRLRINLAEADVPAGLAVKARIRLRARLLPPPEAAVPGAYDYARAAWFTGIGATGRGFAPVVILAPGAAAPPLRAALTGHIVERLPGSAGGIAAALVTGDMGAIGQADSDAMRTAGLAHLLSVSGLHITAVVGATMLLVMRVLALAPWLALRLRLPLVAGGAGAGAAIFYTWLTGAEVPTIRSCVAALLVLAALALGRRAMTLRLVAGGAMLVLLLWPEALVGPSFQLSFAAIVAILALHDHPAVRAFAEPRDEAIGRWLGRHLLLLFATGIAVEAALMPIAVYHFHKAGLYGALANIIAIPLTTFVIMPLELLALLLDTVGLGGPAWWLTGRAIGLLLGGAHMVARLPGATAAWPLMPTGSFALMIGGGLWVMLWRTHWRRWGLAPLLAGAIWAWTPPPPDLVVSGDGRHAAIRLADGRVAMLRDRTGDYMRDVLATNSGVAAPALLSDEGGARCNSDLCLADAGHGAGRLRVLMVRSAYHPPKPALVSACRRADVVVADRRLPGACRPSWLRLEPATLARTGGVAILAGAGRVVTVRRIGDHHPWIRPMLPPRRAAWPAGTRRPGP